MAAESVYPDAEAFNYPQIGVARFQRRSEYQLVLAEGKAVLEGVNVPPAHYQVARTNPATIHDATNQRAMSPIGGRIAQARYLSASVCQGMRSKLMSHW
jgi:hypothetical protein